MSNRATALLCVLWLCLLAVSANRLEQPIEGIVEVTRDNFTSLIGKEKDVFLLIYDPTTEHDDHPFYQMQVLGKSAAKRDEIRFAKQSSKSLTDNQTYVRHAPMSVLHKANGTSYVVNHLGEFTAYMMTLFIRAIKPNTTFILDEMVPDVVELNTTAQVDQQIKTKAVVYIFVYGDNCPFCHTNLASVRGAVMSFQYDNDVFFGKIHETVAKEYSKTHNVELATGSLYRHYVTDKSDKLQPFERSVFSQYLIEEANAATHNGRTLVGDLSQNYGEDRRLSSLFGRLMRERDATVRTAAIKQIEEAAAGFKKFTKRPLQNYSLDYYVALAKKMNTTDGVAVLDQEWDDLKELVFNASFSRAERDHQLLQFNVVNGIYRAVNPHKDSRLSGRDEENDHGHSHGSHGHSHGDHDEDDGDL
ncbi:hypothetical protein ADEAN_000332500 [Angomonas deanei]|uniref:Thioredoxin domain-containing protein n=1 Tax=Angomonas deanei TaxID=59799 RepID=A0A7G2CAG1_9TRYP|nr:hypothetical protein ADEAN_000332500 [Angomonas deanei]